MNDQFKHILNYYKQNKRENKTYYKLTKPGEYIHNHM